MRNGIEERRQQRGEFRVRNAVLPVNGNVLPWMNGKVENLDARVITFPEGEVLVASAVRTHGAFVRTTSPLGTEESSKADTALARASREHARGGVLPGRAFSSRDGISPVHFYPVGNYSSNNGLRLVIMPLLPSDLTGNIPAVVKLAIARNQSVSVLERVFKSVGYKTTSGDGKLYAIRGKNR